MCRIKVCIHKGHTLSKKDKQYYLNLEYGIATRKLTEEEGGGIVAYYTDLPFIAGDGEDIAEAIEDSRSAFSSSLDAVLKEANLLNLSQEEWKNLENELKSPKKSSKGLKELINLESFDA